MSETPSKVGLGAIPVTEERLSIDRRVVDHGAVRVHKHVTESKASVDLPVTRERVHLERVPIGRVLDALPSVRQEGNVTVIPVVEERLVTRKQLVLVEEIRLTRDRESSTATEEVSLRRESVRIERQDPRTKQWLPVEGAESDEPNSGE